MRKATLDFDGGCRGNPGRASCGFVLDVTDDKTGAVGHAEKAWPLGKATNNVAEYLALIGGITHALIQDVDEIVIRGDSKLVVEQVNQRWKCKDYVMGSLRDYALFLLVKFARWELIWIGREENNQADALTASILGERKQDRAARQRREARA